MNAENPTLDKEASRRVRRWGSWLSDAGGAGASDSFGFYPSFRNRLLGFRLVRNK